MTALLLVQLLLCVAVGGCVGFSLRPLVDRWADSKDRCGATAIGALGGHLGPCQRRAGHLVGPISDHVDADGSHWGPLR